MTGATTELWSAFLHDWFYVAAAWFITKQWMDG